MQSRMISNFGMLTRLSKEISKSLLEPYLTFSEKILNTLQKKLSNISEEDYNFLRQAIPNFFPSEVDNNQLGFSASGILYIASFGSLRPSNLYTFISCHSIFISYDKFNRELSKMDSDIYSRNYLRFERDGLVFTSDKNQNSFNFYIDIGKIFNPEFDKLLNMGGKI